MPRTLVWGAFTLGVMAFTGSVWLAYAALDEFRSALHGERT